VLRTILVRLRPNSLHTAASAQLKTRLGRGSPCSPHKIWPSEWKTLAISGKIRGEEVLKSLSVGSPVLQVRFHSDIPFSRLPLVFWDRPEIRGDLRTARARVVFLDVTAGANACELAMESK
jgi:hypothetical protein